MTRLIPSWTTVYAGAVLFYSVILIVVGAWLFPVMTHGGPLGLPFLVLGFVFAPLSIGLWFGHVWVGILALAISLFPGVPLLWKDVVACGKPLGRWLSEVSLVVVAKQFAACLRPLFAPSSLHTWLMIAPFVFAVLTVVCVVTRKRVSTGGVRHGA